jgi:hypothetical protein
MAESKAQAAKRQRTKATRKTGKVIWTTKATAAQPIAKAPSSIAPPRVESQASSEFIGAYSSTSATVTIGLKQTRSSVGRQTRSRKRTRYSESELKSQAEFGSESD